MEATGAEYFGIHVFVGRRVAAGIPEHLYFTMRRSQNLVLSGYQMCGLNRPSEAVATSWNNPLAAGYAAIESGTYKFMTEPVLTPAITAGTLFVLIIGTMASSFVPFVRQILRAIQQSETRKIEAMKQTEVRLIEAIKQIGIQAPPPSVSI